MRVVIGAFQAVEGFFRLLVGDTSKLKQPDLSPLGRAATVDELLHGVADRRR